MIFREGGVRRAMCEALGLFISLQRAFEGAYHGFDFISLIVVTLESVLVDIAYIKRDVE